MHQNTSKVKYIKENHILNTKQERWVSKVIAFGEWDLI